MYLNLKFILSIVLTNKTGKLVLAYLQEFFKLFKSTNVIMEY